MALTESGTKKKLNRVRPASARGPYTVLRQPLPHLELTGKRSQRLQGRFHHGFNKLSHQSLIGTECNRTDYSPVMGFFCFPVKTLNGLLRKQALNPQVHGAGVVARAFTDCSYCPIRQHDS